jgi:hypothetical protein
LRWLSLCRSGCARLVVPVPAAGLVQPLPQLERAHELRLLVVELLVLGVGLLLLVDGPVAHVLHAQRRRDHQHLGQRLTVLGFQDHAAHARVQRQAGQVHAQPGDLVVVIDRAQLVEQLVTVGNGLAQRRLDEGEIVHQPQVQRLHAQDHASQRGAQDFRIGEARAAVKSFSSYSRMQMPLATRPQRPARWLAAAWLIGSICNCSTLLRKL